MNYFNIILGCLVIFTYTEDSYITVPEHVLFEAGNFLEIINKDESFYTTEPSGYSNFISILNDRTIQIMDAPYDKNKDRFLHWIDRADELIKNNEQFKQELTERADLIGGYFKKRMTPLIQDAEDMDHMLKTVLVAVKGEGIYNRRIALKEIRDLYPEIYNLQVTPQLRRWELR